MRISRAAMKRCEKKSVFVFLVVNESLVLIPKTSFIQARDSSVQVPLSSKISISSLVRKSILGRSAPFIPLLFHFKYSMFTTVSSFAATTSAGLLKSLRSTKVFNLQKALILSKNRMSTPHFFPNHESI